jgi:hypothetical protein
MTKKIREIEQALMVLYKMLQRLFPEMHCLDFAVSQTGSKELPYMYGFIHFGGMCYHFSNITDLIIMVRAKIERDGLLYQSFDRLRGTLK